MKTLVKIKKTSTKQCEQTNREEIKVGDFKIVQYTYRIVPEGQKKVKIVRAPNDKGWKEINKSQRSLVDGDGKQYGWIAEHVYKKEKKAN